MAMAWSAQRSPPARLLFNARGSKMGSTGSHGIPCLVMLLALGLLCRGASAAEPGKRRLPTAMVVGAVYCDTCFHQEFTKTSHFISGAVVAVECGGDAAAARPGHFRKEARTNKRGVFRVRLPSWIGKHLKSIQACSVKLVSSGEPFCAVAASATSSFLRLRSRKPGGRLHVFSAGFFTFKPLQQPELCYQEPSPAGISQLGSTKTFAPFTRLPLLTFPQLPQLPALPSMPTLPALPSLGSPTLPKPEAPPSSTVMDQKQDQPAFLPPSPPVPTFGGVPLPTIPFQPPSFLPSNPFQPPSSSLPALAFQPPPPPSFSIPFPRPITPPASSPPPGFLFPAFPFPPNPFFPGIPPAFPSRGAAP